MLNRFGEPPRLLRIVLAVQALVLVATVWLERRLELAPGSGFGEKGPVTWLSVFQLVVCGGLLLIIYTRRRETAAGRGWRSPAFVWLLMGIGFWALACDEKLQIHENVDIQLHVLLAIQETPLTDRLDDLLIGLYGVIGVAVIYCYRGELQQHRRAQPYLFAGMLCFVVTVVLDLLTNGSSIFPPALKPWMKGLGEEGFKLLAEGLFLVAAYDCFLATAARQLGADVSPGQSRRSVANA